MTLEAPMIWNRGKCSNDFNNIGMEKILVIIYMFGCVAQLNACKRPVFFFSFAWSPPSFPRIGDEYWIYDKYMIQTCVT